MSQPTHGTVRKRHRTLTAEMTFELAKFISCIGGRGKLDRNEDSGDLQPVFKVTTALLTKIVSPHIDLISWSGQHFGSLLLKIRPIGQSVTKHNK